MPYTDKQLRANQSIMQRGEPRAVELRTHEDERATGTVRWQTLTPAERGARGRKFMLVCFLLAPVTAVAPPHILWLLGTFTTGIVGYFVRKRQQALVLGGQAHCPKCGAFQLLDAGNGEFPFTHFCSECRKRSVVHLIEEKAVPPEDKATPPEDKATPPEDKAVPPEDKAAPPDEETAPA